MQGLNRNIVKSIDFQFENTNNLPIDSRFLRYFEDITNIPDTTKDYEGMIIFNQYDKFWYTVIKNDNTGNLEYKKLRDVLNNEFYKILKYDTENYSTLLSDVNSLSIKPLFLLVLPLNSFYYFDGTKYICLTSEPFLYTDMDGIKTVPTEFRYRDIQKIQNITDNKIKYWNYTANVEENLIHVSPDIDTFDKSKIINGRIYSDGNFYYLGVTDTDTSNNKLIKLDTPIINKYETEITLSKDGSEVVHNLNSDYLRVILRYKLFNKNYTLFLSDDDFKIIDKNKIFLKHIYSDNIQNCKIKILLR